MCWSHKPGNSDLPCFTWRVNILLRTKVCWVSQLLQIQIKYVYFLLFCLFFNWPFVDFGILVLLVCFALRLNEETHWHQLLVWQVSQIKEWRWTTLLVCSSVRLCDSHAMLTCSRSFRWIIWEPPMSEQNKLPIQLTFNYFTHRKTWNGKD